MARIQITNFLGLVPKDTARAPGDRAQTASNLLPTTTEFRPLAADTTVIANTGLSDPLTAFRLSRNSDGSLNTVFSSTANWIFSGTAKSFAKIAINDSLADRHVVTFDDASAAPRIIDATGTDRLLGVPKPTAAPTTSVNVVDEFTVEERASGLGAAQGTFVQAVKDNATLIWRGVTAPGTTTTGYLDRSATYGFSPVDSSQQVRVYRLSGTGGTIADPYVSGADGANFSWVFDPQLAPFTGDALASPAWAGGAGTPHICVAFCAYGHTYDINTAALSAALTAIEIPGKTDGTKLFTSGQVAAVIAGLVAYVDPDGATVKPMLDALRTNVLELKALLDGGGRTSLAAITTAFYAKADVAATITADISNMALDLFNASKGIAYSSLAIDYNVGFER